MKTITGSIASVLSLLSPVQPLVVCALLFTAIDFVTGVAADRKRSRDKGVRWAFESRKAWRTVYKLTFTTAGIVMAWMIDRYIFPFATLNLANLFTGFVCGVELWSYLENAAELSEHPVFRWLQQYMKQKIDNELTEKNDDLRK